MTNNSCILKNRVDVRKHLNITFVQGTSKRFPCVASNFYFQLTNRKFLSLQQGSTEESRCDSTCRQGGKLCRDHAFWWQHLSLFQSWQIVTYGTVASQKPSELRSPTVPLPGTLQIKIQEAYWMQMASPVTALGTGSLGIARAFPAQGSTAHPIPCTVCNLWITVLGLEGHRFFQCPMRCFICPCEGCTPQSSPANTPGVNRNMSEPIGKPM